jgi:hypothetical protein
VHRFDGAGLDQEWHLASAHDTYVALVNQSCYR